MDSLKVGIREFRSQLPHYLLEVGQPLAITRHGETIGYYIPTRDKTGADNLKALRAAAEKLDRLLQASGVEPDDIVEEFNTRRRESK
jgi:antitoxin (DNA-binding transcriptional repressor) of toxin-antitoxin stability system